MYLSRLMQLHWKGFAEEIGHQFSVCTWNPSVRTHTHTGIFLFMDLLLQSLIKFDTHLLKKNKKAIIPDEV